MDQANGINPDLPLINTIVHEGGTLVGHNTDGEGFIADLGRHVDASAIRRAIILGTGASAAAITSSLARFELDLVIIARNVEAAQRMLSLVDHWRPVRSTILPWMPDSFRESSADLVVNATPVGLDSLESPWPEDVPFPAGALIYDLVYSPIETRMLALANLAGNPTASGLGMLVEQGARSFELWTGVQAPREVMREAVGLIPERLDA